MRELLGTPGAAPRSRRAGDEIEQGLLEVQALIEDTVLRHRSFVSRSAVVTEVPPDEAELSAETARLIGRARHGLRLVLASDVPRARAVYRALEELLAGRGAEVTVQLLCVPETLDREFVGRLLDAGCRLEARTCRLPWMETVMVDHQVVLACTGLVVGKRQAAVIRDFSVIRTMHNLFADVWRRARPGEDRLDFGSLARAEFARRILDRLNAGVTDEAAARDLSVSVRTYRRYVAEIMELLGANSRFQAGARAAELGLLTAARLPQQARRVG
ncbi:LuxR family transcriptional regulator [Kitasatospora sp. NA04385]|uniref:LuxR family transcriptional regulator n=1 Tax=Kitasatospora sp. NA04385 TaxID=2742135 RepID=UPI001163EBE8|nr:LuxR family transcriptional regulator [Kitasatospora sp. NA04385]QDJ74282.1 LuxR family transcriptional regulator [Kitasatospora sp.]QKW22414.1 LuxR family transcriptional regulator [Kitasatospora sp. NA04385]